MFNDTRDLFDLFGGLEHEESRLAALPELFYILSNTAFHCLHEVIKVAPTISYDDPSCLKNLHSALVWLLELAGWQEEDAVLVAFWVGFADGAFKERTLLRTELNDRFEVVDVLRCLNTAANDVDL